MALKLKNERLAWLAGVMDSDGSIGLPANKFGTYLPQVQITNTDYRLLDEVRAIYEELGVVYRVGLMTNGTKNDKHARALNLVVGRQDAVHLLLTTIRPWLVSKADRADILIEFCTLRSEATKNGKGPNARPYDEREHTLFSAARRLQTGYKIYGESHAH